MVVIERYAKDASVTSRIQLSSRIAGLSSKRFTPCNMRQHFGSIAAVNENDGGLCFLHLLQALVVERCYVRN